MASETEIESEAGLDLRGRIKAKRSLVDRYLARARPRKRQRAAPKENALPASGQTGTGPVKALLTTKSGENRGFQVKEAQKRWMRLHASSRVALAVA